MIYRNKSDLLRTHIKSNDVVLDIGFLGQGIKEDDQKWPHFIIKEVAADVYGIDLGISPEYKQDPHYMEASAENFSFPLKFDVIFAGDLIEHLSNPGLFLSCCKEQLKPNGRLILTTPNVFNLFNLTEKLTKREPTVNPDHTFYFNSKTLLKLLEKNGIKANEVSFLYTLEYEHKESWKKKLLNAMYAFLAIFTDKFIETLVIVATL
ncbi:MAG: methyltransferase domain-containing protein [bacterium]